MSRAVFALGLLLALSAAGAPKKKKPRKPAKGAVPARLSVGPGEVKYVTADRAFVDRGTADGVALGQALAVSRGGRQAGICTVDTVAEHFATCTGAGLRKGDRVAVLRAPPQRPPAPPGPPPDDAELARRHRRLEAEALALVAFEGEGAAITTRPRVAAALSHTTFSNLGNDAGPFQQQRVDVAVYDVDVWRGLRVSADLSVLNFSHRPDGVRTAYQQTPVLLVRQLEVGFRRAEVPFSGALGRTWLRYAPGLLVVDGAQASWRSKGGGVETGVYGGLLPDAVSLVPSTGQGAAGAFFMGRLALGEGERQTLLQAEARVGYASKTGLGSRLEAAVAGHLYRGSVLDLHVAAELGVGDAQAPGALDAARLDMGLRPSERFRFVGGARYRGQSSSGVLEVGTVSPGQRALHADGAAVFEVSERLWVGLLGGVATDFSSLLLQARVGPEVTLPGLLGRGSALSLGYVEELGWLRGRHAYVQLVLTGFGRLRVINRTSWFHQQGAAGAEGLAGHEAGTTLGLDVRFLRWLWLRAGLSGRLQLDDPTKAGGLVSVQLGGQL